MSDDLDDLLREWLRKRGATDQSTVDALADHVATLPSRRRGPGRNLAAAAAVIAALGLGAFTLIPRLVSTSSQPSSPVSSDPAAWIGDPRLDACRVYVADPAQVFEMTHAQWFPLHFPGWWKGAPELEVDDPALVVVGREQRWPILGAPPAPGQTVDPDAGLGYQMCIAVGTPGGFTTHDYGVTHFDRIVPVLSDADIARAAHLDPDVLGDPAAWPFPERLAPCGGLTGNELYIFEANPLRDFPRYFPAAHPVAAMETDDSGIVIVYRDPLPLRRAINAPSGPAIKDVCVVFNSPNPNGSSAILPEIDITGFHLRLDMPGASSPTPSATASAEASRPALTPEPGPAWAGDARSVLECDGTPVDLGSEATPNPDEVLSGTPEDVVTAIERRVWAFGLDVPFKGFEASTIEGSARLFVNRVDGRVKAAIAVTVSPGGSQWIASSVASCGDADLDPTTPTGTHPFGRWTDPSGTPVATTILSAVPDCYDGTQVTYKGRLYVRAPSGGVDPSQTETSWAANVRLPASAVATPYRSGALRLFVAADRKAIYVLTGDRAERLPHAINDEVLRTDCN